MNVVKTGILLAAMTALFGVVGYLIGGPMGMLFALGLGVVTNLIAFWNSDRLALAAHNAQEVDAQSAPELVAMVQELSARAGIPMPRVYLIDEAQPNAFATGRSPERSAVAATTGLLNMLTREEVAGVMAHEIAHIRNRDTLIMTVAATIAGAISSLVNIGLMFGGGRDRPNIVVSLLLMFLAPMAAAIVQMAISRTREYAADRLGGALCGNPLWLAAALERIAGGVAHIPNERAEMKPATAHMFIINPLSGRGFDNLFSTHPATENRIHELMLQAQALEQSYAGPSGAPPHGPWG
jgi:heat shock protein HtpX